MPRAFKAAIAALQPALRSCLVVALLAGLGTVLGRAQHPALAAGPWADGSGLVAGVISSRIRCLSAGGAPTRVDAEICPSAGSVALNWQGEAERARLVLTTAGATAAHSIFVNGELAARAPLSAPAPSGEGSFPGIDDAPVLAGQGTWAEVHYLTIPVDLVIQGENRIEIAADEASANASSADRWLATDVRIELFGPRGQPGLVALPVETDTAGLLGAADVSVSAVRSVIAFANAYDGTLQEAAIQVPDGYNSDLPTPLVIYVHGRSGVMSGGIDQFGDAANAKGWLLASPELHGSWDVPAECYVYPNDCTWDDQVLAGTTSPSAEPRPGAYAYASLESQYDIVGTVRYMVEHYNVKLDQIYLYGVSMGGQAAAVVAAKYPHLFAATLETMGPTDSGLWHDEQIDVIGRYSPDLRAMRKECHVDGVEQYPDENPFCYQQRSGLYFARNYVIEPGARPPISITHSTADVLVPVHHSRDLRDAINAFGPALPVEIYEDQIAGPTCPPYYHCYGPAPMASLDYFEPHTLNNTPTHVQIASDQTKSYYWLNLVQSGGDHWSYVEATAYEGTTSLVVEALDTHALDLGVNLGREPLPVPELGSALLQPGLGFPSTTYLVRGSAGDGLHDYSSGYLAVPVAAGQSVVTISAIDVVLAANPTTVFLDPQGLAEISVDVRDRLGNAVPDGTEVQLATTWGLFENGNAAHSVYTTDGAATAVLALEAGRDLAQVTAACRGVSDSVDLLLETDPGADTPTPSATPAETSAPTPTPTATPQAGSVFSLRHELDLSEYQSLTGSEDLSQSAASALAGTSGGLAVTIDDQTSSYGEARFTPPAASSYRYRFYVDPNGLEMVDWRNFVLARTRSGGTPRQWIVLRRHTGGYDLRLVVRDDAGSVRYADWRTIADDEHYVEVLVRHASSASAADGLVAWSIDGVLAEQIETLDIYDADKRPGNWQMGAVLGVDAGTLGTLYLDEAVLREGETEIGPVGDTPPPEPTHTPTVTTAPTQTAPAPTPAATTTPPATATPTATPTLPEDATPTPTATAAPMPTAEPGGEPVLEVRHEVDLSGYSRLVGGADLGQSSAAALAGTSGGMAVSIDDQTVRYAEAQFAGLTAPAHRYRFYIDARGLTMRDWESLILARTRARYTAQQWLVLRGRSGGHELRLAVRDDNGSVRYSAWHALAAGERYVEVWVRYAAGPAASDGLAALSVDGTIVDQVGSLDIYDVDNRPDNLQLGAIWGVDAGTQGILYLDEVILREGEAEIGPVGDAPPPEPTSTPTGTAAPTSTPTPLDDATPTPIPTPTPTATATPAPTTDPGAAPIAEVRHEVDLSEYDHLVGSDALSQSAAAALAGTAGGLEVPLQALTARYGQVQFAALAAPSFRWRFHLDTNGIEMVNWRNFIVARTRSGGTARQWVVLRYRDGLYELRLVVRDDTGVVHYSTYHVISDAEHYVEVSVRHASGDTAGDGLVELWVDGVRGPVLGSLDLFDAGRRPDNLQLGAVAGVDAGTLGTLYLDELLLREGEAEIGSALP